MFHCLLELIWVFTSSSSGTLQGPGSSPSGASTAVDPCFLVCLQNPSDSSWPELDLHEPTQALINLSAGVVILICLTLQLIERNHCWFKEMTWASRRRAVSSLFKGKFLTWKQVHWKNPSRCYCSASKSINKVCVSPRSHVLNNLLQQWSLIDDALPVLCSQVAHLLTYVY